MAAIDPTSVAGKDFPVAGHADLIVVGAGPAGIAAAQEARELGLDVMLVDEHPVASALIGLDVPYMFGERLDAAVQNKPRMLERVVGNRPEIAKLFESGADVRLGIYAWGAFANEASCRVPARRLLGLADESHSWLVSFDRMIVAAGARDLAVAFPGWDRPGVMGACGFSTAAGLYQAFLGRRIAVLGAGSLGLKVAQQALEAGIEVAGIVDVEGAAPGPALQDLLEHRVAIHAGHAVLAVEGGAELAGIRVAPLGRKEAHFEIACDTIVSALDLVPVGELFDLLGCKIAWRAELGGFVPVVDDEGRTSVSGIYAAGDCAGVTDAAIGDPAIAAAAGLSAARAAARDGGVAAERLAAPVGGANADRTGHARAWLAAHLDAAKETVICRCEEVSLSDLIGVRPPRYLTYDKERFVARNLRSLAAEGPVNQDQIKRLTRAGMGSCQGRRCREQVHLLLTLQGNQPSGSVPMPSYRAPLRPLPLNVLGAHDETAEMRQNWVTWFGIPSQWLPHWQQVPDGEALSDHRIGLWDVSK
ncbi:MAG: FAD-dependent oxidoreductase [Acetobacteraceae bacterium]